MSRMLFKNILIADVQQKRARYLTFEEGLNVITSRDNHVGKSSVLKLLYNTLGAEVHTDTRWDQNSKIAVVTIDVNGREYRVARFLRKFAIFQGERLILLTDSVTRELAPRLGDIFDFSVYLAKKDGNKEVVQAPPVFSYMPYYIDQDKGWSELYGSFESIDQFAKPERAKSIYFHLGLYNKARIDNQAEKDRLRSEIAELVEEENRIMITIKAMSKEVDNLIPADNAEELDRYLEKPREEIEILVREIGYERNKIQELETTLLEHEHQLDVLKSYQKIQSDFSEEKKSIHVCPRCGYEFDDDLYTLVRNSYNLSNEEYLVAQIQLIIDNIKTELKEKKDHYVSLMKQLKEQEEVYNESQKAYDVYIKYKGLSDTLQKYQKEYGMNKLLQAEKEDEIKELEKELRKIPDRKETEDKYISNVKSNLLDLNVWDSSYEGKIKLLRAINAQGSLMPKVVLSQYIGLYQTMNGMQSSVIRFPFVVDSPRSMEPSDTSSKQILDFIVNKTSLPQIILATVDYDKFGIQDDGKVNRIYLTEQFKLLNEETYKDKEQEIQGLYDLLRE